MHVNEGSWRGARVVVGTWRRRDRSHMDRIMDPCWSLRSTLHRYACAWAAPDPVNRCPALLVSPDPSTQAPPTPPVAPWARPPAATTRSLHLCTLQLSPATTLPRLRFLASSLALASGLPTSSPLPSATLTPPSTSRSALRTPSRPGLTARKPGVKPNLPITVLSQ